MLTGITLTLNIYNHSVANTCRNIDFYNFIALNDTCTTTMLTLVFDDRTFTMAVWTFCLCLHHTKHSANTLYHNTTTSTF